MLDCAEVPGADIEDGGADLVADLVAVLANGEGVLDELGSL